MKIISKSKTLLSKPVDDDDDIQEIEEVETQKYIPRFEVGPLIFGIYSASGWYVCGKNKKGNDGQKHYYPDCLSVMEYGARMLAHDRTHEKHIKTLEGYIQEYKKATKEIAKALRGE